jgi:hypothetical protein
MLVPMKSLRTEYMSCLRALELDAGPSRLAGLAWMVLVPVKWGCMVLGRWAGLGQR